MLACGCPAAGIVLCPYPLHVMRMSPEGQHQHNRPHKQQQHRQQDTYHQHLHCAGSIAATAHNIGVRSLLLGSILPVSHTQSAQSDSHIHNYSVYQGQPHPVSSGRFTHSQLLCIPRSATPSQLRAIHTFTITLYTKVSHTQSAQDDSHIHSYSVYQGQTHPVSSGRFTHSQLLCIPRSATPSQLIHTFTITMYTKVSHTQSAQSDSHIHNYSVYQGQPHPVSSGRFTHSQLLCIPRSDTSSQLRTIHTFIITLYTKVSHTQSAQDDSHIHNYYVYQGQPHPVSSGGFTRS